MTLPGRKSMSNAKQAKRKKENWIKSQCAMAWAYSYCHYGNHNWILKLNVGCFSCVACNVVNKGNPVHKSVSLLHENTAEFDNQRTKAKAKLRFGTFYDMNVFTRTKKAEKAYNLKRLFQHRECFMLNNFKWRVLFFSHCLLKQVIAARNWFNKPSPFAPNHGLC